MAVGKKLRFEVFKRDKFACVYCGRTPPAVTLEADHVHPASRGGADTMHNLVTACHECNQGKRNNPLSAKSFDEMLAHRTQELYARLEQLKAYNEAKLQEQYYLDGQCNLIADTWLYKAGKNPENGDRLSEPQATYIRSIINALPTCAILEEIDKAFNAVRPSRTTDLQWGLFRNACEIKIRGVGAF